MDQIDEYEQGERVRAWLKNNGSSLITGVALGLAALGGWQWWQNQGEVRKVEAAAEFLAYSRASEGEQTDKALAHAQALVQNHPETPYVALVALNEAQRLQAEGKAEEALAKLDAVSPEHLDPALAELLQLRAMRLLARPGSRTNPTLDHLDRAVDHAVVQFGLIGEFHAIEAGLALWGAACRQY